MVRKVTAYFAFSAAHRAAVREESQAAAGPEGKVGVAAVAQALGRKWQALDDTEKDRYKQLAAEQSQAAADAEAAAAATAAQCSSRADAPDQHRDGSAEPDGLAAGAADAAQPDRAADTSRPAALPVSVVKRIMMLDEDVGRVSAGGVRAIGAAAELWLVRMAERAVGVAAASKRKTLKFSDVQAVATKDRRLGDMGLQEIYDHEDTFAEARGTGDENVSRLEMSHTLPPGDPRAAKKRRKDSTPGPEARPITSFFIGGPKQPQASSEAVLQPTAT